MRIPPEQSAWLEADPLGDEAARDGAVWAYRQYLATFDVEPTGIGAILVSLDRFYVFLGLGAVRLLPSPAAGRRVCGPWFGRLTEDAATLTSAF